MFQPENQKRLWVPASAQLGFGCRPRIRPKRRAMDPKTSLRCSSRVVTAYTGAARWRRHQEGKTSQRASFLESWNQPLYDIFQGRGKGHWLGLWQ